ncbi:MAG: hypothetical protein P8O16_08060 [Algoriphagus sp.]|uniref:hypothetical protein n=1 Tax=Algoriphagus sp. TaxID=1872435 RepID=UPI00262CCB2C|nr:hypothetical protein [Algoriphagus sp.]MDG1277218.1 hypothetical protein [Algoriphagus sp.]
MKKTLITNRLAILGIAFTFLWSCSQDLTQEQIIPEQELADPTLEQALSAWEKLDIDAGYSINSRKKVDYNYFEVFKNKLFFVPAEGYIGGPAPAFYPGTGEGIATKMSKPTSFINQLAQIQNNELITLGAPVSMFFANELSAFGISGLPENVSSITVDRKGNSIWYKNVKNIVTSVNETLSSFTAEIEIIGGTGKFKGATGSGVVRGNFNPLSGDGSSVTMATIDKKDDRDDDDDDRKDKKDKKDKDKKDRD